VNSRRKLSANDNNNGETEVAIQEHGIADKQDAETIIRFLDGCRDTKQALRICSGASENLFWMGDLA
jgi:hypothetical protein